MTRVNELKEILRKRPDGYRSGDIEGYLSYYSPEITSYFDGIISDYEDSCDFIRKLFADGGRMLEFTTGDRSDIRFSQNGEAAYLCYPWSERFQFGDGRVTDSDYFQSEVWMHRDGHWMLYHVHLTLLNETVASV